MIRSAIVLAMMAALSTSYQQSARHFQGMSWPLSDGISELWLVDDKTSLRIVFFGPGVRTNRGEVPQPPPPPISGVQMWVLRKDGTALRQLSGIRVNGVVSNAGSASVSAQLAFEHVEASDLAGIVVMVRGKLLVREIKSN